jgi:hypothetical protein
MRLLTNEEIGLVDGGGGLEFVNDAAHALGEAVGKAVNAIQNEGTSLILQAVATVNNYQAAGAIR